MGASPTRAKEAIRADVATADAASNLVIEAKAIRAKAAKAAKAKAKTRAKEARAKTALNQETRRNRPIRSVQAGLHQVKTIVLFADFMPKAGALRAAIVTFGIQRSAEILSLASAKMRTVFLCT